VNKAESMPGLRAAYREKRSIDDPLHQVEVVDGVVRDRQVKVLFVDGEREGLRSWVPTQQLLCAWASVSRCSGKSERSTGSRATGTRSTTR
jgi:hypothetical protein